MSWQGEEDCDVAYWVSQYEKTLDRLIAEQERNVALVRDNDRLRAQLVTTTEQLRIIEQLQYELRKAQE